MTKLGQRMDMCCSVILRRVHIQESPYHGIEKANPPKKARWSAAAIFEVENGKIKSFTKDWDQKVMQVSACDILSPGTCL
jgi:hypothetical protein